MSGKFAEVRYMLIDKIEIFLGLNTRAELSKFMKLKSQFIVNNNERSDIFG